MGTTTKLLKAYGLPTHRPPTSPGETVAHFLEDLDLSQAEAARALGLSANRLNEVVKNKRGISADTALRLAAYFGTSAQFWLNVQDAWDLWHELQRGSKTYGAILQRRPRAVREAAREASVPAASVPGSGPARTQASNDSLSPISRFAPLA